MTMTFRARFDGTALVPETSVDLPRDLTLEVRVTEVPEVEHPEGSLLRLASLARRFPSVPDTPTDRAEQHDHYLYGSPRN